MCTDIIDDGTRFDGARPLDGGWHTETTFPLCRLLIAEHRRTAVRPGKYLCAVIRGVHDNGVVFNTQFLELGQQLDNMAVVFDHAIGVNTKACLAF